MPTDDCSALPDPSDCIETQTRVGRRAHWAWRQKVGVWLVSVRPEGQTEDSNLLSFMSTLHFYHLNELIRGWLSLHVLSFLISHFGVFVVKGSWVQQWGNKKINWHVLKCFNHPLCVCVGALENPRTALLVFTSKASLLLSYERWKCNVLRSLIRHFLSCSELKNILHC